MKGKKGILLLLLVLILAGALTWQFVIKKKPKKAKAPKAKPPVEQVQPVEAPAVPPSGPPTPPPASPEAPPPQGMPSLFPPSGPQPEVSPEAPLPSPPGGAPPASPGPGVPKAQQFGAETQPMIGLNLGPELRLPEGTTMVLEQARVQYQGQRPLQYQWELLSGPEDKIEIQGPRELRARIILGNLEKPERFLLRLRATDGLTEASEELPITAFPSQLKLVAQMGGAWRAVRHMGDKWVALRGRQLEIFGPDVKPLGRVEFDFDIRNFFAMANGANRGALYAQDPQGNWVVAQNDPLRGLQIHRLPMLGRKINHLIPFQLENQPYAFALLEKNIELWNLHEARSPKLRKTLLTQLNHPAFLAFLGRHLYVADEQSIEILDFSTGQALASVPSGGSITALATYTVAGKGHLLAAIGRDRTSQNRKDYGLRLFEIDSGGRLGQEKRLSVENGAPVQGALVIPGVNRALLTVAGEQGVEIKMLDLATGNFLPLHYASPPNFIALDEMATGKLGDQSIALVADGSQLRVLSFQASGPGYEVSFLENFPGILSAQWVLSNPGGSRLWIGDEGTLSGGSLGLAEGSDLKMVQTFTAKGLNPLDAARTAGSDTAYLLYGASNPQALPPDSTEGELGVLDLNGPQGPQRSKAFLGLQSAQGELRPLGLAVQAVEGGVQIAVAIARVRGALGGAGIALLTRAGTQPAAAFLAQDLKALESTLPLQDARDVGLSPDAKAAFLASGAEGVVAVDLQKKLPVSRMSLGPKWTADRILVSRGGQWVLASFIEPGSTQVIVKIFGIGKDLQLTEYGTLQGLKAVKTLNGLRAPRLALTSDDLYLFAPLGENNLTVFNMTNPAQPLKIAEITLPGSVQSIALANRFRDVFVAMGQSGVAKLEFGFVVPAGAETRPETMPESGPLQAETQPTP